MGISSNAVLKRLKFPALPRKTSSPKNKKIGKLPIVFDKTKANIVLYYYDFIQTQFARGRTLEFEEAYKCFYLRNAKRKPSWNSADYNFYFNLLFSLKLTKSHLSEVDNVAMKLQKNLSGGGYQLSFASKLVHTIDNSCPIIDSKVVEYLKKYEGISFSYNDPKARYDSLCKWYLNFKKDSRYKAWISFFDKEFPKYKTISNEKKIDFILFFCN